MAAAPERQVADLGSGTAILQYEGGSPTGAALDTQLATLDLRAVKQFRALEMFAVTGTIGQLRAAARLPGVTAAHQEELLEYELYQSTPLIYRGVEQRNALFAQGFNGTGVNVAVVDSGVTGFHPDLEKRIVRNRKFVAGVGADCVPQPKCQTDTESGHGTHVAGTAVGDGTASGGFFTGVAPGAGLVGLAVGVGPSIPNINVVAAYDFILSNPALNIKVVNNSFGPATDGVRFDSKAPINVATKKLFEAGIVSVWAAGNSGTNDPDSGDPGAGEAAPPDGASDCSTREGEDGKREATEGACKINPNSVAPWVVSVAAGRKADARTVKTTGGPGEQFLAFFSSRGDPRPQVALSGETINYVPTLTAPGVNVRAPRNPNGESNVTGAFSAEQNAAAPPRNNPSDEQNYLALSGTSMSSPHVAGAVAVVQSAARAKLGRFLTPDEVKRLLQESAAPMPAKDGYYDFPCGQSALFIDCGDRVSGTTGQPYASWQVGAGYLDMPALIARVDSLAQTPPPAPAACGDAADNDGDAKTDFPADPGCTGPADTDETDPVQSAAGPVAPCSDGLDNDGDGKVDLADPGCAGPADADEADGTLPPPRPVPPACLPPAPEIMQRGVGPIRIGDRRARVIKRAGAPQSRTRRTFTYCVTGGGRVVAVFGKGRRIVFIGSTATRGAHGALQLGDPASKVRRFYGKIPRVDRDLLARKRGKRIAFGVRAGRLTFVGVLNRAVLRTTKQIRRERRAAGF